MLAISACTTPHTENGSTAASIHPETTLHAPTPGFILYPFRAMPHFPCIVWQKFGAPLQWDRSAAKPFTRDEAFLIALNIAKLPSVPRQILKPSGSRYYPLCLSAFSRQIRSRQE
jgi:hypothetical protein